MKFFQRRDFIFAHIVTASIYWSSVAHGEDNIVPLTKGAPAPFDGQLFDAPTATRWGLLLQGIPERNALLRKKERGICEAELAFKDGVLKTQLAKDEVLLEDLKTRLLRVDGARIKLQDELNNPPWYKTFWFGFGVGAVSASVLIVVANKAF